MTTQKNAIEIEILADGTVKVMTGSIGGPEHMAAERMLTWLAQQMGGNAVRTKTAHSHHHEHEHEHEHAHGHGHEH